MKSSLLPILLLPAMCAAQQAQVEPPAASPTQTPPVMPNVTAVPAPSQINLPAGPANDADRPLTADEAAKLALRVQPTLRLAQAQLLASRGRLQIVKAGLLPTLGLSATYGRQIVVDQGVFSFPASSTNSSTTSGTTTTSSSASTQTGTYAGLGSSVTLRQLLFDFNHTRNLVRQADAQEKAAGHGLTLAQLNLVYAVKQAYYTYVLDQALVAVQEANVTNTQAELDLATAQLKAGLGAPANVVTATSAVGSAQEALNLSRQTALIARINLAIAIGVDPRTPITASTSEEPAPPSTDVNALVGQALKQRPDILQLIESLHAAGYELSAARTANAPSLNLSVQGSTRGSDQPFGSSTGSVGLSVSWNLFDAGAAAGSVKVAQADIQTAQSQLDTVTQTAISDVASAFVNLKSAEQQVLIADATVKNALEGVRLAQGRFKAGVAIFIEVTTAQTTLVQAQSSLVSAQTNVQQARAQLRRAIGQM